jgi:putative DNA primase/helicase
MERTPFVIDEIRVSEEIGFDEKGELQEANCAENFLDKNDLIRVLQEFYILCPKNQIWEKITEEGIKRLAYKMFPATGPYIWRKKYENSYYPAIKMLTKIVDKVNPYPHKINFQDIVYNFGDCRYEPKSKENYFTDEKDFSILDAVEETPVFDKFIADITLGKESLKKYLLVVLAYLISGDKKLQKFFILKGSGANGKSTLINLLMRLIGDSFVTSISLRKINDRFTLSKAIGKKLIVASENESVKGVSTETIKKLTGDDLVEIEQKYKDGFSDRLKVETLFSVNNTIQFSENSYGLKRRLEVIPFDFRVAEDDMDIDLERKLEKEIPGIMLKLIKIHKKFAKGGYKLPKCEEVEKAKKQFLDEGMRDSLGSGVFDFLEGNIEVEKGSRCEKRLVYQAYLNSNTGGCTPTKFWMDFNKWKDYKGYDEIGEVQNQQRIKTGVRLKSKINALLR